MQIGGFTIPENPVRYHDAYRHRDLLGQGREIRRDICTDLLVAIDRDKDGKVVQAGYMTECCTAAVTYPGDGGGLCCKKCWNYVDPALDQLIDFADVAVFEGSGTAGRRNRRR